MKRRSRLLSSQHCSLSQAGLTFERFAVDPHFWLGLNPQRRDLGHILTLHLVFAAFWHQGVCMRIVGAVAIRVECFPSGEMADRVGSG